MLILKGGVEMDGVILGIFILIFFIVAGAFKKGGRRYFEEGLSLMGYRCIEVSDEGLRDALWDAVQQLEEYTSTRNKLRESDLRRIKSLNAMIKGIGSLEGLDFSILQNLMELNLSYNGIRSLREVDFRGLDRLRILSLTFNVLESLDGVDFRGLDNLKTLNLNENEIDRVEGVGVGSLHNLRILDLGLNKISSLKGLDLGGLYNLNYLNLRLNHIRSLEGANFKRLHSLKYLNLDFNRIDTMDGFREAVEGLNNLTVSMYDNPITATEEYRVLKGDRNTNITFIP